MTDSEQEPKSNKNYNQNVGLLNIKRESLFSFLYKSIPACFTVFIFNVIDYIGVAMVYFPPPNIDNKGITGPITNFNYQSLSRLLFVLSAVQSMITYNIFTGFGWGVYAGSIIENMAFTRKILSTTISMVHKDMPNDGKNSVLIHGYDESVVKVIVNVVFCCMIATILFSALSYCLYKSGLSNILEYTPTPVLAGFMGGIAVSQFNIFLSAVEVPKNDSVYYSLQIFGTNVSLKMLILGIILGVTIYSLTINLPNFNYTILLSVVISTSLAYLGVYFNSGSEFIKTLQKHKILSESTDSAFLSILDFYKMIMKYTYIDLKILWACKFSIINIACFSTLHLPINYNVYKGYIANDINSEETIKKHGSSLEKEMRAQSSLNLVSAFTSFLPAYILGSYSVGYYRSGGKSKLIAIFSALFTPSIPFLGPMFEKYMPVFVSGSIPVYMCLCFATDFWIDIYNKLMCYIYERGKPITEKQSNVDYDNLVESNFRSFSVLPAHLRNSDFIDFIIASIVLYLFLNLGDASVLCVFVGLFLCFIKQVVYLHYINKKDVGNNSTLSSSYGMNFQQIITYKNRKYSVYKPLTINLWNLRMLDKDQLDIIYDLRDVEYIDILSVGRFGDDVLVIY